MSHCDPAKDFQPPGSAAHIPVSKVRIRPLGGNVVSVVAVLGHELVSIGGHLMLVMTAVLAAFCGI